MVSLLGSPGAAAGASSSGAGPLRRFYLPLRDLPGDQDSHVESPAQAPRGHLRPRLALDDAQLRVERESTGRKLLRGRSFRAPCAKNQLTLCVHLPTHEEARKLMPEAETLASGMHGMEVLLLQQFVEKDWGDDLLLLTATEEPSGHLVGMIFWRYLRRPDDEHWSQVHVDWRAAFGPGAAHHLAGGRPLADAWTLIELLCTDQKYRGHGIGKLLLGSALAYSAVKDGRAAAVLTLGHGDQNTAAKELYQKLGFEEMPEEYFLPPEEESQGSTVDPRHVLVVWDIKKSLRSLTLGSLVGTSKGTVVPQLLEQVGPSSTSRAAAKELRRLDTRDCLEVVQGLTGAPVSVPEAAEEAVRQPAEAG